MNERTVSIAQELARGDHQCTLEGLASEHGVSQRTIRNDIKCLNRYLVDKNLTALEYGAGGLIVVPPDFLRVLTSLPLQGFYSYKMSSEERKILAAVTLAEASGYVTLADIADRFSVSRATILNDLDGIKDIVQVAGLTVESRPNRGLIAHGDEIERRSFLLSFVLERATLAEQWMASAEHKAMRDDSVTVRKILNEQNKRHRASMDDRSFRAIDSYLCIALSRCRAGMSILDTRKEEAGLVDRASDEYKYAEDALRLLSQYFDVEMGEGEAVHFTLVLESAGYRSDAVFSIEDVQIQTVTRRFVGNVSEELGVDLNGDYQLFEYLSNHLESMFSAASARFPVNPSLREVVTDQPAVLDAVKDNLYVLESYSKRRITEVETIYIALHICAALERHKNTERRLRAIVVCDEGVGTAQLVAEELRGRFDIRVVKVIPAHEVPYLEPFLADLVISTVPMSECPIQNVAAVLPLTDRDYVRIRRKIEEVRRTSVCCDPIDEVGAQGLLDRIEPIIERVLPDGGEEVIRQVRTEVRRYFHEAQHMEEELITPQLHQLLPASHIQLDVECSDWRDAIAKSALPLVRSGYVEERYIEAMIRKVEEYGTYIVLTPNFAIPHEAPNKGALKVGMNLIRLKEPVPFGADELDPIEFVCTLSAVDHKTHLKAFFNLLSMLTKPGLPFTDALRTARTPEEAATAIESFEYQVVS